MVKKIEIQSIKNYFLSMLDKNQEKSIIYGNDSWRLGYKKTYLEYCRVRNNVKNMITYFRKQKERNISMDIKNNPKAFWKYISMQTKTKSDITVIQWMSQADLLIMTFRKQIY